MDECPITLGQLTRYALRGRDREVVCPYPLQQEVLPCVYCTTKTLQTHRPSVGFLCWTSVQLFPWTVVQSFSCTGVQSLPPWGIYEAQRFRLLPGVLPQPRQAGDLASFADGDELTDDGRFSVL